jgi:hypothetical protein
MMCITNGGVMEQTTERKALEEILKVAEDKHTDYQRRYRAKSDELMAEVNKKLADEFEKEYRETSNALGLAQKNLKEYTEAQRIAETQSKLPYPIGTIFELWKNTNTWVTGGVWKKTNETAILEIFTSDSDYPDNLRLNRPCVGEVILRILKKDSSKGKKTVRWHCRLGYGEKWLTENETVENAKNS